MQHHDEVDVNKDGKITKEVTLFMQSEPAEASVWWWHLTRCWHNVLQEWLAPDSPAPMDPFSHMGYNKDKLVTFEEFAKNEREHYHGCPLPPCTSRLLRTLWLAARATTAHPCLLC